MRIDQRLNIVVPVEQADGSTVHVHAAPLPREVFERYFMVISKTFARIYGEGLGYIAAPKISGLLLKEVATELGQWDDVKAGLLAEIRRLSNVLVLGANGWETIPLEEAVRQKLFDEDDGADVDGVLIFFIVNSAMHRKAALRVSLEAASKLWGAQVTSLNCTEFAASLPTLTETDSSGGKAVSVVHAILDWAANDGLPEILRLGNLEYGTAHEYRQRHLESLFFRRPPSAG